MEPIIFLSTSPTFMLVSNGLIPELKSEGRIRPLECRMTIETESKLRGSSDEFPYRFVRWYDFSRTATSVVRVFMLEASGMRVHCDPNFSTKQKNLDASKNNEYLRTPTQRHLEMAHGSSDRAERIAAEFDRLFPHRVIEYKLNKMAVGETKTLSGHMYVIYFDESTLYEINANVDVEFESKTTEWKKIPAYVHVSVSRYHFDYPMINSSNYRQFERCSLLKKLIDEWLPSQGSDPSDELPDIQNLSLSN